MAEVKKNRKAKRGEEGYWERNKRKFKSAEELQKKIDEYFEVSHEKEEVVSEHGLARFLGISRVTLYDWWRGGNCNDLQETVVMAYDRIAEEYLQLLHTGDKNMTSFVIFALKQMAFGGYKDKVESSNETTVKVIHGNSIDDSDFK